MLHWLQKPTPATGIGYRRRTIVPDSNTTYAETLFLHDEQQRQVRQQVKTVLLTLTARQKGVIYLRYYEGLNFEDIARNMNLSVKACYKLMGRAITVLRENMVCSLLFIICIGHLNINGWH